jgi:hypothetical protein
MISCRRCAAAAVKSIIITMVSVDRHRHVGSKA